MRSVWPLAKSVYTVAFMAVIAIGAIGCGGEKSSTGDAGGGAGSTGVAAGKGGSSEGGGEDGSAGDGGLQTQLSSDGQGARVCEAHLEWEKKCAALEPTPPQEPYWGETECLNGPWRYVQERFIEAAAACFASLSCESSDDACTAAGFEAIGIETAADIENDSLASRCLKIANQCMDLNGDACLSLAAFTQEGRSAAASCLDLDCSQIETCLDDPG